MSADLVASGPDNRDLRAAEYAVGTLPPGERAAVEIERVVDPAMAAAVSAWVTRLVPLALSAAEVRPAERVWAGIARALPAAGGANVRDLHQQVRRWRLAAAGTGLLAAGLELFIAVGPLREAARPERYVAVVQSGGALPALIVSVDTAGGTAQVRPVGAETPAGRSLELWYIEAGAAPKPLGVIGERPSQIALQAPAPDGVLAVSVEPTGGSPTDQPTGPVIYTGKLIHE